MSEADETKETELPSTTEAAQPAEQTQTAKEDAGTTGEDRPSGEGTAAASEPDPDAEIRVAIPKDLGEDAEAAEAGRKRRARRRRQVQPAEPPSEEGSEPPKANSRTAPRRKRPRGRRSEASKRSREAGGQGARDGADGKRRSDEPVTPVGGAPSRTIFQQDTVAPTEGPAPGATETAGRADEDRSKAASKSSDKDKITLMLHPAPKVAPQKRKKKKRPKTAKEALRKKTAQTTKQEKRDRQAELELEPAWRQVGADGAVDALESAGKAGEALVKAWLEDNNADAIIAAARSDRIKGKGRKAARRALGVLKSRGIEIPEEPPKGTPATVEEQPEEPIATFIPPDATGTAFVSVSQRQPGGRYHVADAVIRRGTGVLQVSSGYIAGREIRNWKSRVEEQFGAAPVQVPLAWARHRVAEARKANDTSGEIVPLGFDKAQSLLAPVPEEEPPHPLADLEEEAVEARVVEKATLDSEILHTEPEMRSWMPRRGAMDELLKKVGERVGPEQAHETAVVDEALETELAAAVDRYFTPELRKELRAQMRDAAISIRERKGEEAAKKVLAVGKAVEDAGLVTKPPSEIPFLKTFFQKAIASILRQNQGKLRIPATQQNA